jgi:hypothetical protein
VYSSCVRGHFEEVTGSTPFVTSSFSSILASWCFNLLSSCSVAAIWARRAEALVVAASIVVVVKVCELLIKIQGPQEKIRLHERASLNIMQPHYSATTTHHTTFSQPKKRLER